MRRRRHRPSRAHLSGASRPISVSPALRTVYCARAGARARVFLEFGQNPSSLSRFYLNGDRSGSTAIRRVTPIVFKSGYAADMARAEPVAWEHSYAGQRRYVVDCVQSTRSRHELMMLSDRELWDMGLERIYPPEIGLHSPRPRHTRRQPKTPWRINEVHLLRGSIRAVKSSARRG